MLEQMGIGELKRFAKKIGIAKPMKDKQQLIAQMREIIASHVRMNKEKLANGDGDLHID